VKSARQKLQCRLLSRSAFTDEGWHVADQLQRAASSVAANYRAACFVEPLSGEANELVAIFTAGQTTTRRKMEEKKAKREHKRGS
jgi:hypothetical protein